MDLPYNWDFIQNSIQIEKLMELRKRFMEEWRSGKYTTEEMLERYRMSERTFYTMIKKYSEAREIDDYREDSRAPKLKAQKKKIWDARPGVRKIKAILDELWASAKRAKTISKSYTTIYCRNLEDTLKGIKGINQKN